MGIEELKNSDMDRTAREYECEERMDRYPPLEKFCNETETKVYEILAESLRDLFDLGDEDIRQVLSIVRKEEVGQILKANLISFTFNGMENLK